MKYIITVCIGFILVSCINSGTQNKSILVTFDTTHTALEPSADTQDADLTSGVSEEGKKETEMVIKNRSEYSGKFVKALKELGFKKVELQDSLLIVDGEDTTYFPAAPRRGQQMTLTGKKGNLAIALTITRVNYTTIDYKVEMVEFGVTSHHHSGQADMSSGFLLGEESDQSEKTGNSYFVTEFTDDEDKECYTYIRLGYEEETGPYLLGKLKKNCNGKVKAITLDNFTTLMEK